MESVLILSKRHMPVLVRHTPVYVENITQEEATRKKFVYAIRGIHPVYLKAQARVRRLKVKGLSREIT